MLNRIIVFFVLVATGFSVQGQVHNIHNANIVDDTLLGGLGQQVNFSGNIQIEFGITLELAAGTTVITEPNTTFSINGKLKLGGDATRSELNAGSNTSFTFGSTDGFTTSIELCNVEADFNTCTFSGSSTDLLIVDASQLNFSACNAHNLVIVSQLSNIDSEQYSGNPSGFVFDRFTSTNARIVLRNDDVASVKNSTFGIDTQWAFQLVGAEIEFDDCAFDQATGSLGSGSSFGPIGSIVAQSTTLSLRDCQFSDLSARLEEQKFNQTIPSFATLSEDESDQDSEDETGLETDDETTNENLFNNGQRGAAISCTDGQLTITNCAFNACTSLKEGGAIYTQNASLSVHASVFENCTSENGTGGAIYAQAGKVYLEENQFKQNSAQEGNGGAIYAQTCDINLLNNQFKANTSEAYGGAMAFLGTSSTVYNNLFLKNKATKGASSFYLNGDQSPVGSTNTLANNVFYRNSNTDTENSYTFVAKNAEFGLYNSILWQNYSSENATEVVGKQLEVDIGKRLPYIMYNAMSGGADAIQLSLDIDTKENIHHNTNENPLFTEPENEDFTLLPSSPLINASLMSVVGQDLINWEKDLYGNNRVYKTTHADIGVAESSVLHNLKDSLALVAIYKATNGEAWNQQYGWLSKNINQWYGVKLVGGRVYELKLENNGLSGSLPAALKNLSGLKDLNLSGNALTSFPIEILELVDIYRVDLSYNAIAQLPDLSGNKFVELDLFDISGNQLSFDDLLPNRGVPNLYYSNQDSIGVELNLFVQHGDQLVLSMEGLENHHSALIYSWKKGNTELQSGSDSTFTISDFQLADAGTYYCSANHFELPLLDLPRKKINLSYLPPAANTNDSLVLVKLYEVCGGEKWIDQENWLETALKDWEGVSVVSGRVVKLDLAYNSLSGSLPVEINQLTALRELELNNNALAGNFIFDFAQLSLLEKFSVANNKITGDLLASNIGAATALQYVAVDNNALTGALPDDIDQLSELQTLEIGSNLFSGSLANIAGLSNLTALYASNNAFESTINFDLHTITTLEIINLSNNRISGDFPILPMGMTHVNFSNNAFESQSLPDLSYLSEVEEIDLSNNAFRGEIPETYGDCTFLQKLILNSNQLTGELPQQIGNLTELRILQLDHNKLSGNLPSTWLKLSKLETLDLGFNSLSGEIPNTFNMPDLEYLGLDNNNFEGSIPESIGALSTLVDLKLYANLLSGEIPDTLGNLTFLETLELNKNKLSGQVPASLGKLTALQTLSLRTNLLDGTLPIQLTELKNLERFYIYDNKLDSIPDFSQLENLEVFQVFDNYLEFDDIIANNKSALDYQYAPQYAQTQNIPVSIGDTITLGRNVSGNGNKYLWKTGLHNNWGNEPSENPYATLHGVTADSVGLYTVQITNEAAPGLTLVDTVLLTMLPQKPNVTQPAHYCFGDEKIQLEASNGGSQTHWYWASNTEQHVATGKHFSVSIETDTDTVYVVNIIGTEVSDTTLVEILYRPTVLFTDGEFAVDALSDASYTWQFNDSTFAEGTRATPFADGIYTLTVFRNGCAAVSNRVQLKEGNVQVLDNDFIVATLEPPRAQEAKLVLFPNPTHDMLHLHCSNAYSGQLELLISNLQGQTVYHTYAYKDKSSWQKTLHISSLPQGQYIVRLRLGTTTIVKQVVKN